MTEEQKATCAATSRSVGTIAALDVADRGATGTLSGMATATSSIPPIYTGGMATGLSIIVAVPVALGAAAYGLYKWFND